MSLYRRKRRYKSLDDRVREITDRAIEESLAEIEIAFVELFERPRISGTLKIRA